MQVVRGKNLRAYGIHHLSVGELKRVHPEGREGRIVTGSCMIESTSCTDPGMSYNYGSYVDYKGVQGYNSFGEPVKQFDLYSYSEAQSMNSFSLSTQSVYYEVCGPYYASGFLIDQQERHGGSAGTLSVSLTILAPSHEPKGARQSGTHTFNSSLVNFTDDTWGYACY